MRKGRMIFMPVMVLGIMLLCLTGCEKSAFPELDAAQEAVDAAKAEGAPDLCPDEYASAELKLKQAQLLYEDNEMDSATDAAKTAETNGKAALDCALLAKQPQQADGLALPDDLAEFKESVYFEFNDNTLSPGQVQKVVEVAGLLKKHQDTYKFWVVVVGHADLPGSPEDNQVVSDHRARVVRYVLVQNGVNPKRILIRAMGEELANKELILDPKVEVKKGALKQNKVYRRADILIFAEKPKAK